ncbi:hypothetical protein OOK29_25795 [Streptomyces phaeochromogenes]|uniref:hypothetical protein n=1 Tax=Streptomyces phaeochromogenes TaxID=1923 RepID=UPI0022592525|nr:hypothetical protein [Streptomyces phaeochromogenes]MCX5601567.1 hypothetical protein [Streptomyces phaeochromogenes]
MIWLLYGVLAVLGLFAVAVLVGYVLAALNHTDTDAAYEVQDEDGLDESVARHPSGQAPMPPVPAQPAPGFGRGQAPREPVFLPRQTRRSKES